MDTPGIELKKYISGNGILLGRSFGLNFWIWKDLGLGSVFDRGGATLQVLNQSSEIDSFLLGLKYRFKGWKKHFDIDLRIDYTSK